MKNLRKPYRKRGRFFNCKNDKVQGFFYKSAKMLLQSVSLFWSNPQKGQELWIGKACPLSCSVAPVITWIGHASFLIQVGGINILVDPIFGDVTFLYKRILPPGIALEQMPKIDYVLISHNHIDHMDGPTLRAIKGKNKDVVFLVPQGDKAWFDKRGFENCHEHMWWDQRSFCPPGEPKNQVTFSFLPASHWSQRGMFDKNRSLWGSWMIDCSGSRIYFAGDTYFDSHFSEIAQEFPNIDVALLPVGPCEPHKVLKDWHLDAQEAGKAFLQLGAKYFVPMHWGAFAFGVEHFDKPIEMIKAWWEKNTDLLTEKKLRCMKVGQSVAFSNNDATLKQE